MSKKKKNQNIEIFHLALKTYYSSQLIVLQINFIFQFDYLPCHSQCQPLGPDHFFHRRFPEKILRIETIIVEHCNQIWNWSSHFV